MGLNLQDGVGDVLSNGELLWDMVGESSSGTGGGGGSGGEGGTRLQPEKHIQCK